MPSFYGIGDSLGYQQLAVDTAQGLTLPTSGTVQFCMITVEGQAVRWLDTGANPTTTNGMPIAVNGYLRYDANAINSLKFIGQTTGSKINVTYYGKK